MYTVANESCDELNVFDVHTGELKKKIPCDIITPNSDTHFITGEDDRIYTINKTGIHSMEKDGSQSELLISNNNQLANEDYEINGAYMLETDNATDFYVWYVNQNENSEDSGASHLCKYTISE